MSNTRQQQLQNPDNAGPYRLPAGLEAELTGAASALEWPTATYRPTSASDTEQWLAGLGQQLGFPEYFGANFDALYDCLTDVEILNAPGQVLVLGNLTPLGEDVDILIAVLQAASDEWREQGRALWLLLDAPKLDLDPLPKA